MKRITDYRKLFNITADTDLKHLKLVYRNLMKEWHPDKFQKGDELFAEAEVKSKTIIEAYHFLVSISPETHAHHAEAYALTTNTLGIDDFVYKGQTLKVTFQGVVFMNTLVFQKTFITNFLVHQPRLVLQEGIFFIRIFIEA